MVSVEKYFIVYGIVIFAIVICEYCCNYKIYTFSRGTLFYSIYLFMFASDSAKRCTEGSGMIIYSWMDRNLKLRISSQRSYKVDSY